MTQTLVIYDNEGYIISKSQGFPPLREPIGIPFLWIEVPSNKYLKGVGEIGVDVSVTPNVAILDDVKPSEIELLNLRLSQQEDALIEIANLVVGAVR